jgi:hypothetical protein
VSFSLVTKDCSWYNACDLSNPDLTIDHYQSASTTYHYSDSACGANTITDETTCTAAAAALGYTWASVTGSEWATGCLFNDGSVYFSPVEDGSADNPTDAYICKSGAGDDGGADTGCYLAYCNAHQDLKDEFCASELCISSDQVAACHDHWESSGRSEAGHGLRTANPDVCIMCEAEGWLENGYTCVGSQCAAMGQHGIPDRCVTRSPDGYVMDSNTGTCTWGNGASVLGITPTFLSSSGQAEQISMTALNHHNGIMMDMCLAAGQEEWALETLGATVLETSSTIGNSFADNIHNTLANTPSASGGNGDTSFMFGNGDMAQTIVVDLGQLRPVNRIGASYGVGDREVWDMCAFEVGVDLESQYTPFGAVGKDDGVRDIVEATTWVRSSEAVQIRYVKFKFGAGSTDRGGAGSRIERLYVQHVALPVAGDAITLQKCDRSSDEGWLYQSDGTIRPSSQPDLCMAGLDFEELIHLEPCNGMDVSSIAYGQFIDAATAALGAPDGVDSPQVLYGSGVNMLGHSGFSGLGFVDFLSPQNETIEFSVPHLTAGSHTVAVRYALAGLPDGTDRPLEVSVNGAVLAVSESENAQFSNDGLLHFPPTGDWITWGRTVAVRVEMVDGANLVTLRNTGASGTNRGSSFDPLTTNLEPAHML